MTLEMCNYQTSCLVKYMSFTSILRPQLLPLPPLSVTFTTKTVGYDWQAEVRVCIKMQHNKCEILQIPLTVLCFARIENKSTKVTKVVNASAATHTHTHTHTVPERQNKSGFY